VFEIYLISYCAFLQQTCYNRCISKDELITTVIPSTEFHIQSLSTVTMSTNSSVLQFERAAETTTHIANVTASAANTSVASVLPSMKSCREPLSYVSAFTLSVLWHVVYWTSQALTWFAVLCCILLSFHTVFE